MYCYFSPQAVRDLEEIGDYIAERSPLRAVSFIEELRGHCTKLCDFPRAFPLRPELGKDVRILAAGSYNIYYTVREDHVVIERILNAARDVDVLF